MIYKEVNGESLDGVHLEHPCLCLYIWHVGSWKGRPQIMDENTRGFPVDPVHDVDVRR